MNIPSQSRSVPPTPQRAKAAGSPSPLADEPALPSPHESFQATAAAVSDGPSEETEALPAIVIAASPEVAPRDLARLRSVAHDAMLYFRENFGPVASELRFEVGKATDALRTGYNFVNDAICLPYLDSVKNAGLDSDDVINHEIFHALLIKAYPDLPSPEELPTVRLHEGLADLFAHRLNPDAQFGEGYYTEKDAVRHYHTDLRISLSSGSHAQGNALTSLLLSQEVENREIRSFLEAGDFSLTGLEASSPAMKEALQRDGSLAVNETVSAYPHSPKGRYWLAPEKPLAIAFEPNESLQKEHPDFRVVWLDKSGYPSRSYTFEPTGNNAFLVSGAPEANAEKVIARFYDGDKVVGFRPFYFGVRDDRPGVTPPAEAN